MKRMHGLLKLTLSALLIFLLSGCDARLSDTFRLHNHISVDGMDISAKTVGEARAALQTNANERLDSTQVSLLLPEATVTMPAAQLGIMLDIEQALLEASRLERDGGTRIIFSRYSADKRLLYEAANRFAAAYSRGPRNASLSVDKYAAIPVRYQEEQVGLTIDSQALGDALLKAVEAGDITHVTVPYAVVEPDIPLSSIQERQSLVAQFSTSFEGAPHNDAGRVHNIRKAAELINGVVLSPGEEFDCNAVLGDRTLENGWQEAPGIRNGRYENEYGGGVCQVSSTLFNAVMMADLSITERSPHSWPMGYVDIGRDATISTGGKNFCFINTTDEPLYIFMHVDEALENVTASLYGRPLPNGGYIAVSSEKTGTLESAGHEILLDETLPYNTELVIREARDGKTAITYKEYYSRDGTLLDKQIAYEDTYRAIDSLVYVSTDLYYGMLAEPTQAE